MKPRVCLLLSSALLAVSGCGGGRDEPEPDPPTPGPPAPTGALRALASSPGFTVLHFFTGGKDGAHPLGLVRDGTGNLYGTTLAGGDTDCIVTGLTNGCGVVFRLSAEGEFTVLHAFSLGPAEGAAPLSGPVRDAAGNLEGETSSGGAFGLGTRYRLDPEGRLAVLENLSDGVAAPITELQSKPIGPLLADGAGNLYGTAFIGGIANCTAGCGIVFEIAANQ
ncbi:MAG: choice-of-anchor tandem repeat GloVer-containing protein [Gammaproteobacteria bacterium]